MTAEAIRLQSCYINCRAQGFDALARVIGEMLRAECRRELRANYGRVEPDGSAFAAVERPAVSMTEDR